MKNKQLAIDMLEMKEKIDKISIKAATLDGKLENEKENLKSEFDCNSFREASGLIMILKNEIEKEESELENEIKQLKLKFEEVE